MFTAVDHWRAECVGWHVCKRGDRFAALEPVAQGLQRTVGHIGRDCGHGLALRMDHGSQYTSDHFQKQLEHWGIKKSYAFVSEPQTNGVAERFNRTLKEQVIYGRVFEDLEELRQAVGTFIIQYNQEWNVEKLGFISPKTARENYGLLKAA